MVEKAFSSMLGTQRVHVYIARKPLPESPKTDVVHVLVSIFEQS